MADRVVPPGGHGDPTDERQEGSRESAPLPARVPENVPEADAIEQAQPVDDESTVATDELVSIDPEVPERDALEQATAIPEVEDRR